MRRLSTVFNEFAILALWIGLMLSGWETFLAVASMPDKPAFPFQWIHFILYSLGGFILLAIVFLIPGLIICIILRIFRGKWERKDIRRFLLSGAIGTGLLIVVAALQFELIRPFINAIGYGPQLAIMAIVLVFSCYIIGAVLSTGTLAIIETRSARSIWVILWGWFLFMVTVPSMGIALFKSADALNSIFLWIIVVVIAGIILLALTRLLPRFYDWMHRAGQKRWIGAVVILVVVYIATTPWPEKIKGGAPAGSGAPPIVLITIDTLRPDALDCYPQGDCMRLGTPNINRIAGEGVIFDRAWANAPWTLPSVATILSGLPPSVHGAKDDRRSVLTPGATTLAEILNEAGYVTGGVAVCNLLARGSGLDQGFDSYEEIMTIQQENRRLLFQRLLDRFRLIWPDLVTPNNNPMMERDAVKRARRFIREHSDERFFLWLHLYAPHSTWYPPREYRDLAEDKFGLEINLREVTRQPNLKSGQAPITLSARNQVLALYAGEVTFADDSVGGVIEELENLGILDDCLVVITSDHGEEFYEHDQIGHSHSLNPELLHVPLVMRYPGAIRPGSHVNVMVSLVDLVPTVLDLAGIDAGLGGEAAVLTGRSLVPAMNGGEFEFREIFAESPLMFDRNIISVISEDVWNGSGDIFYYIGGVDNVFHPRLYNLNRDTDTWYDIRRHNPDIADDMSAMVEEYKYGCDELATAVGAVDDVSIRERLRSLGYLN